MNPLRISEIWIYPIKSLRGIPLERAQVRGKGLRYDRRWMLIDKNNVAMTQRIYPKMALFTPGIVDEKIAVTFGKPNEVNVSVNFSTSIPQAYNPITARIWDDEVEVVEVNPDISQWFSHHLETACRLVAFPEENERQVNRNYSINNEQVSLADAYPFLIIGQRSLDDLNARLTQTVPMNRFRPNFVFTGGEAFIEDNWKNLSIGKVPFAAVKKSDRCVLTTVNQETAEKGAEPLRTLSGYRKIGNAVYFGQNLVALKEGEVRVGDSVIPV